MSAKDNWHTRYFLLLNQPRELFASGHIRLCQVLSPVSLKVDTNLSARPGEVSRKRRLPDCEMEHRSRSLQAPLVGKWSDVYGRKPFLMMTFICASFTITVLFLNLNFGVSMFFYFPAQVKLLMVHLLL